MANLAIGTAAEVVRHSPTIWNGIRSGYASIRKELGNIKSAMAGSDVEGVRNQILLLTAELDSVIDSMEETTDRIEELELELERERQDNAHNRVVFQAVWDWSQQSWLKRTFSRPAVPPQNLWRNSSQPKPDK